MRISTLGLFALFLFGIGAAHAETVNSRWIVAESANACLVNCASQNDSCKRVCPTTYSGPCISACDNQAQFCRQSCQR